MTLTNIIHNGQNVERKRGRQTEKIGKDLNENKIYATEKEETQTETENISHFQMQKSMLSFRDIARWR